MLLLAVAGCAHIPENLDTLVRAEMFEQAVAAVSGRPEAAAALASEILAAAAIQDAHRFYALERLSVTGKAGREVLEDLAERQDITGRAARVASRRFDKPDEQMKIACREDDAPDVRLFCAFAWYRYFSEAALKDFVVDIDPTVRLYALRGLAAIQTVSGRAAIFADVLHRDPSFAVQAAAARRGDLLGDDALLMLKDRLWDDRTGMRIAAVEGLARIGTSEAKALLTSIATGPPDETALSAAAALAASGDSIGTRRLLDGLADRRPGVRTAALYLLSRANIADATARIAKHLEDKSPEVVTAAANLLRQKEEYRSRIIEQLKRIAKIETADTAGIRNLQALLGDATALQQIRNAFRAPSQLTEASLVLNLDMLVGTPALFDAVVPLMGDPRETVRIHSAIFILFSMSKI